jgi:hypothetical protein
MVCVCVCVCVCVPRSVLAVAIGHGSLAELRQTLRLLSLTAISPKLILSDVFTRCMCCVPLCVCSLLVSRSNSYTAPHSACVDAVK